MNFLDLTSLWIVNRAPYSAMLGGDKLVHEFALLFYDKYIGILMNRMNLLLKWRSFRVNMIERSRRIDGVQFVLYSINIGRELHSTSRYVLTEINPPRTNVR